MKVKKNAVVGSVSRLSNKQQTDNVYYFFLNLQDRVAGRA